MDQNEAFSAIVKTFAVVVEAAFAVWSFELLVRTLLGGHRNFNRAIVTTEIVVVGVVDLGHFRLRKRFVAPRAAILEITPQEHFTYEWVPLYASGKASPRL